MPATTLLKPDTRTSTCAVIVTYHPGPSILETLQKLSPQVQGVVIVDNGSPSHELDILRNASRSFGFHLIENGENLGIAEALNQGVRWAKSKEFPWVLLLDQDSKMGDHLVQGMFKAWLSHPKRGEVACVHPRYMHPEIGYTRIAPRASDGSLVWCLTSGALMPAWIFDKIGWFASEFFIDWVDIEYCFRLRAAGYMLAEAPDAILVHDPGQAAPASILGLRFWPSHHSAWRRYYMSRNRIVVFRKYLFTLPRWTLQAIFAGFRDIAKCFLGEKDRSRKFRNFLLGTWDGLIGKMGTREGL